MDCVRLGRRKARVENDPERPPLFLLFRRLLLLVRAILGHSLLLCTLWRPLLRLQRLAIARFLLETCGQRRRLVLSASLVRLALITSNSLFSLSFVLSGVLARPQPVCTSRGNGSTRRRLVRLAWAHC